VLQADLVLGLLLTDEANPRAVGFQLATLLHQMQRLADLRVHDNDDEPREFAFNALAAVRDVKLPEIAARNSDGEFAALEDLVEDLKLRLYSLSDVLNATYLSPVKISRLTESW